MSHITLVNGQIKDLEAVKALCREKGWEFLEGKKTSTFWGGAQHPCDHAIKVPGAYDDAELGLVRNSDGSYSLAYDPMCFKSGLIDSCSKGGKLGGVFMQSYLICKTEREAKRNGMVARRVPGKNGAVKLLLTGGSLR